jgi:low temperature requirement protein LtrA
MNAELRDEDSVKPLELFFDLVFVLAFTQCTQLMAARPDWAGIGHGVLVLAVLWWAWVCYAWLTSLLDPEEGAVRLVMLAAMAGLLIVGLCVPEAFGDRALIFAIAYGAVRMGHVALYAIAAPAGLGLRRWVYRFGLSTAVVIALLVGASFLDGAAQAAVWGLAIALDVSVPAFSGVSEWRLAPRHFAERHNLVIILALGESVIVLGIGAERDLTTMVIVAAVLGMGVASALWWIYFDLVALVTERRLIRAAEGRERNALARDSYSYLHFPMVAGIVLVALGLEETVLHVDEPLQTETAFALLGGAAIYLLAHVALRLRNARTINPERLGVAVVLLALIPVVVHIASVWAVVVVNVLLWSMIAYEHNFVYDQRRHAMRHGQEVDLPEDEGRPGGAG